MEFAEDIAALKATLHCNNIIVLSNLEYTNVSLLSSLSTDSCMTRRITNAGIRYDKALALERRLKAFKIPERLIVKTPPLILGIVMRISILNVQAIQECIGKALE